MRPHIVWMIAFCSAAFSCRKEDHEFKGRGHAEINGVRWKAALGASKSGGNQSRFNLNFQAVDSRGVLTEELGILHIPLKTGRNRVWRLTFPSPDTAKVAAGFFTLSGGDVGCEQYRVVEADSAANYIEVQNIHPGNGHVSGSFALKLAIQLPKCKPSSPDTLVVRNGTFTAQIR